VTEPNNFVEHFIDSTGVVSWRFFSAKADYDFVEWDFSGQGENSNADEAAALFGILEGMGKEAYMAVYDQLGATACRILVPGYSEIYPVEDLIWDNTNKALLFRADILNLHRLNDASLKALLERLEDCELDDYTDIITLLGIEFDENTAWGQLTILELKLLIHLALQQFEAAHELVRTFLQYNENTVERGLFYQALNVVLEVVLDDEVFGKPADAADAARMLAQLSGRTHRVISTLWLVSAGRELQATSISEVTFESLTPERIAAYIGTGDPGTKVVFADGRELDFKDKTAAR
jgi:ribosomal protein S12 methylthiotransferase accessory factor